MESKRLILLCGLMLLLLPTQVYGATLQYASGALAVTPYIYGKITEDACGIPDPPVIGEYNPGPFVGINNLSGSKDLTIVGCMSEITSHVSWDLQAAYGKKFSLSTETYNWLNRYGNTSENRCSIRMNTQDGLILQVTPEAGEKIGQAVKLYLSYNIFAGSAVGSTNADNDPADLIFESVGSQPNRITVNSVPKYSFPSSHISVNCSTSDCISWPADCGPVQFHISSHDGPYPFQYEVEPETFITVNPGELIEYSWWGREFFVFDYPLQCKIGDLIGLNLGYFQEVSDIRSDLDGYPEIFTKFDFTMTAQVVPLPGSVFLLGAGLLLLAGVRAAHRS